MFRKEKTSVLMKQNNEKGHLTNFRQTHWIGIRGREEKEEVEVCQYKLQVKYFEKNTKYIIKIMMQID